MYESADTPELGNAPRHVYSMSHSSYVLLLPALLLAGPVMAQPDDLSPHSDAELIAEMQSVRPGETFEVGLRMTMEPEWHSYWINPGDAGMPTEVQWRLPEGFEAEEIRWPFPERIDQPPLASYGYSHEVLLPITITPPADLTNETVTLEGKAVWLICADICLPAEQEVSLTVSISEAAPETDPDWAEAFAETRNAFPAVLNEWTSQATATESGYRLHLTASGAETTDLTDAFFFVDEKAVLQHAVPQEFVADGNGYAVDLVASNFATENSSRLTGALVLPEGGTWDGTHRALAVDAEIDSAPPAAQQTSTASLSLLVALLFAFIGGLILNLMPCVFPILSIKILGFAQGRDHSRSTLRNHGLMFGLGVVVSFWLLAGTLLVLRAGGEQIGWGFQLQSPWLIGGLALLMFALGLMLVGVFEIGFSLASAGGRLDKREGLGGAFWSGVLATIVATPCTAPFMGTALGYALGQPAISALAVFTLLGVGMATPYVLLSLFPRWIHRLPKPGQWMESLKQALGFPLFATAAWLVWVFGLQTGINGAANLLLAMTLLGLGAWVLGRWGLPTRSPKQRMIARVAVVVTLVLAFLATGRGVRQTAAAVATEAANSEWRVFDPTEVDRLVSAGQPVFVDFTAAWCLSCQANKAVTLNASSVQEAFRDKGVVRFRADWTQRDPVITAALESFGRSGVPLYVLYPPGGDPVLLPAILSAGIVNDALERLPTTIASDSRPPSP